MMVTNYMMYSGDHLGKPACHRTTATLSPSSRESAGGQPCIRGLRLTVYDVLEYLESGMSEDEILADFPDLSPEDIRACLAFAAAQEHRLASLPPV